MMLRPVSIADGRLDPDRLRPYEAELEYREARGMPVLMLGGRRMVSATCWWDPAYGVHARQGMAAEGRTGDGSVVAALFSDGEGGYWLHRLRYLTALPATRTRTRRRSNAVKSRSSSAISTCRR